MISGGFAADGKNFALSFNLFIYIANVFQTFSAILPRKLKFTTSLVINGTSRENIQNTFGSIS